MTYLTNLKNNSAKYQAKLNQIIKNNKGQIVGNGYIDIIVSRENSVNFIERK